jgi:hypothetical protein
VYASQQGLLHNLYMASAHSYTLKCTRATFNVPKLGSPVPVPGLLATTCWYTIALHPIIGCWEHTTVVLHCNNLLIATTLRPRRNALRSPWQMPMLVIGYAYQMQGLHSAPAAVALRCAL